MTPGSRISIARQRAGITQAALAQQLGIQHSQRQRVSQWEHDEAMPRIPTLEAIAEALDTTPAWIMFGVGDAPQKKATE